MVLPFQVINFFLVISLLVLLAWYLWDVMLDRNYQPARWQQAVRMGSVGVALKKVERHYPDKVRFFTWWLQVDRLKREGVTGAFAELGVYKGESVKILHLMDETRRFHLFDTFTGFMECDLVLETGEASTYTTANFADTAIEQVKRYLGGEECYVFHPGYFPDSTAGLTEAYYALVNIDADLYNPTLAGLTYFYPRLSPGGVLLVHDYNSRWTGVIKAVDEFLKEIPEVPTLIPDQNGTIMIIRNK